METRVLFLAKQFAGLDGEVDADGVIAYHFPHGQDLRGMGDSWQEHLPATHSVKTDNPFNGHFVLHFATHFTYVEYRL